MDFKKLKEDKKRQREFQRRQAAQTMIAQATAGKTT